MNDPQKHLETLLEIRDAVWIEGEEDGRYEKQTEKGIVKEEHRWRIEK
jgi:hypothetical protein